ncbi:MAG: hypothetical protein QM796_18660 [Chthoniobacteraceae bacterium]
MKVIEWVELIPATVSERTEVSNSSSGSFHGQSSVYGTAYDSDGNVQTTATHTFSIALAGQQQAGGTISPGFTMQTFSASADLGDGYPNAEYGTTYDDYSSASTAVRNEYYVFPSSGSPHTTFDYAESHTTFGPISTHTQTTTQRPATIYSHYSTTQPLASSDRGTAITGTILSSSNGTSMVTYASTTSTVFYTSTSTTSSSSSMGTTLGTTGGTATLANGSYWELTHYLAENDDVGYFYEVQDGDQLTSISRAGALFSPFTSKSIRPNVQSAGVNFSLVNPSATFSYATVTAEPPDEHPTYHGTTLDPTTTTIVTDASAIPMGTTTRSVSTGKLVTLTGTNAGFPIHTYGDSFVAHATKTSTLGAAWSVTATTTAFLVTAIDGRGTTTPAVTLVSTSSAWTNTVEDTAVFFSYENTEGSTDSDHTDAGVTHGGGGMSVTSTWAVGYQWTGINGTNATLHSAQAGGYKLAPKIDTSDTVPALFLSANHALASEMVAFSSVLDFGPQQVLVSGPAHGSVVGSDGTSGYDFAASWSGNRATFTLQNWSRSASAATATAASGTTQSFSAEVTSARAQALGIATTESLSGLPGEELDLPFLAGGHHPHPPAVDTLYFAPGYYEVSTPTGTSSYLKQGETTVSVATSQLSAILPGLAFGACTVTNGGMANTIILVETRNEQP